MKKVKLGHSGLFISQEGFGCMGLSEFYGDVNRDSAKALLRQTIEHGINFLDTADVYGFGANEELVGEVLKDVDRSTIVLATKCGIIRDINDVNKRGVDNSYDYILRCYEKSITRLGTDIDLYYLHRVVNDKSVMKEAMRAMAKLLEEEKIKAVGLSEVNAELLRYADASLKEQTGGKHGISAVQSEYSLMTRSVERNGVLECCDELGATFVAYSPICRGLLSGKLDHIDNLDKNDFRRHLPRFSGENLLHNNIIVKELENIASRKNCTTTQLVLSWLLHSPYNVVPIPGTKREKYLQENARATEVELSPQEWREISDLTNNFDVVGQRYTESAMKSFGFDE